MRPDRFARDERGSVLVLGVGLVVICILAITVLVDVSTALLQRQRLQAFADGAALAGAQAVDVPAYYAEGASSSTRLDRVRVADVARRHLDSAVADDTLDELVVERIWSDGRQVVISIRAPLRLPFLDDLFSADIRVESSAQLAYREYRGVS